MISRKFGRRISDKLERCGVVGIVLLSYGVLWNFNIAAYHYMDITLKDREHLIIKTCSVRSIFF